MENNGVLFDPGFSEHVYAFAETLNYLYQDINKYKNFSQKRIKFMQYHKKILSLFYNNIGFYTGCLMWAAYIKTLPEQKILNNPYLGEEYQIDIETSGIKFLQTFLNTFPKDVKYYLAQDFIFNEKIKNLIFSYEEFIIINKGFINSEKNIDIKLPSNINNNAETYKNLIDDAISQKDLSILKEQIDLVLNK